MSLSLILDCSKVARYYPHEKLNANEYSLKKVYKYSLLYNLPLVSLFSYRDMFIPACAKGLWLSLVFIIMICISLIVFMTGLVNDSVIITSLAISPALAILLVPNSILIRILRFNNKKRAL